MCGSAVNRGGGGEGARRQKDGSDTPIKRVESERFGLICNGRAGERVQEKGNQILNET